MLFTWFGFGEASSHGGPRIEGHPGRGRERGRGGEVQSDRGAGLLVLEVTVMQSWRSENLQVQAGHRTRQLLHIIWMHRASEIVNNTHTVTLWWRAVKTTSIRKCTCVVFIITKLIFVFMSVLLMCSWCRSEMCEGRRSQTLRRANPATVYLCLCNMLVLVKRKQLC